MFKQQNDIFLLSTKNTSLVLRKNEQGTISSEYYGPRIPNIEGCFGLAMPHTNPTGNSAVKEENGFVSLDSVNAIYSTYGIGDYFYPSIVLNNDKTNIFDFAFKGLEVGKPHKNPLFPTPQDANEEVVITCFDSATSTTLKLHYFIYEESDVIANYAEIRNDSDDILHIKRCASLQLSLVNRDFELISTYGSWANEGNIEITPIKYGRFIVESTSGSSSAKHNPFIYIRQKNHAIDDGLAYGFNLVYSGNHEESVEMDPFQNIRIQTGISSLGLDKTIGHKESFVTPIAVMSFSKDGQVGLSHNFSKFVNESVIRKEFQYKDRPIIYNNWEATGPSFTKEKLFLLMEKAKDLGIETFVLDDGWFGNRNDDSHGLGDWFVNEDKLPGGLKSLSDKANELGLSFGIWMEPEMVNDDAVVYKEHPDWIINDGLHKTIKGRNQYTLDLRKQEVQDFAFESVANTLKSANINYLKWDYNRPMASFPDGVGNFVYDYMVGLYKVLDRVVTAFPNILFENCAGGGNRFDLGMLSFFPQSWMSDDTDIHVRANLQKAFLVGYPLSVFSNHVSAKTSNQLLRYSSLESKFDIASFGVLGYELDLNDLTPLDEEIIKKQISFYKEHRHMLQFGEHSLIQDLDVEHKLIQQVQNDSEVIVSYYSMLQLPNPRNDFLLAKGLDADATYVYENRQETLNIKKFGHLINNLSPVHIGEDSLAQAELASKQGMDGEVTKGKALGSVLMGLGVPLPDEWKMTGLNPGTRVMGDFAARLYVIKKE